jgi:hypothetical protein
MFLCQKEFKDIAEIGDPDTLVYPYGMIPEYPREEISTIFSLGSHDGPVIGIITINGKFYLAECLEVEIAPRIFLILEIKAEHMRLFLNYCFWYSKFKSDGICYNYDGSRGSCMNPPNNLVVPPGEVIHPNLEIDVSYAKILGYFKSWKLLY